VKTNKDMSTIAVIPLNQGIRHSDYINDNQLQNMAIKNYYKNIHLFNTNIRVNKALEREKEKERAKGLKIFYNRDTGKIDCINSKKKLYIWHLKDSANLGEMLEITAPDHIYHKKSLNIFKLRKTLITSYKKKESQERIYNDLHTIPNNIVKNILKTTNIGNDLAMTFFQIISIGHVVYHSEKMEDDSIRYYHMLCCSTKYEADFKHYCKKNLYLQGLVLTQNVIKTAFLDYSKSNISNIELTESMIDKCYVYVYDELRDGKIRHIHNYLNTPYSFNLELDINSVNNSIGCKKRAITDYYIRRMLSARFEERGKKFLSASTSASNTTSASSSYTTYRNNSYSKEYFDNVFSEKSIDSYVNSYSLMREYDVPNIAKDREMQFLLHCRKAGLPIRYNRWYAPIRQVAHNKTVISNFPIFNKLFDIRDNLLFTHHECYDEFLKGSDIFKKTALNIYEFNSLTQIQCHTIITQVYHSVLGHTIYLQYLTVYRKNGKIIDYYRCVIKNGGEAVPTIQNAISDKRFMLLGYKKTKLRSGKEAIVTLDLTGSELVIYSKYEGKCRANRVIVLRIQELTVYENVAILGKEYDECVSIHDSNYVYKTGTMCAVDNFDDNHLRDVCTGGIHFFFNVALACSYMAGGSHQQYIYAVNDSLTPLKDCTFDNTEMTDLDVAIEFFKKTRDFGLFKHIGCKVSIDKINNKLVIEDGSAFLEKKYSIMDNQQIMRILDSTNNKDDDKEVDCSNRCNKECKNKHSSIRKQKENKRAKVNVKFLDKPKDDMPDLIFTLDNKVSKPKIMSNSNDKSTNAQSLTSAQILTNSYGKFGYIFCDLI